MASSQEPRPPQEPRSRPPRPGQTAETTNTVQIRDDTFRSLCALMRTNELLGAAAAKELEAAAGLDVAGSIQGNCAKGLRSAVAENREDQAAPVADAKPAMEAPLHEDLCDFHECLRLLSTLSVNDLERKTREVALADAEIGMGSKVEVLLDFESDGDSTISLKAGQRGLVEQIDAEGDACICVGRRRVWVFKRNFAKLRVDCEIVPEVKEELLAEARKFLRVLSDATAAVQSAIEHLTKAATPSSRTGDLKKFPPDGQEFTNANTSPEQWGMTIAQFSDFFDEAVRNKEIDVEKGANMYEICDKMVKPLTRGTGRSVALEANKTKPLTAQLMISHAWQEAFAEVHEAITTHCADTTADKQTVMWFCTLSQYQPGDESGDCGPTVKEQIAKDPIGSVIRAIGATSGVGMLAVHVTQADLYSRLWCVYEINEALDMELHVQSALSKKEKERWQETRHKWLHDGPENGGWELGEDTWAGVMPRIFPTQDTSEAICSKPEDEDLIKGEVEKSGGFERLNQIIDDFRKRTFLTFMR